MRLFFFQAEDGIRDLVRSRGLGDVYKRQAKDEVVIRSTGAPTYFASDIAYHYEKFVRRGFDPVSYTHLTLPTSDLV